MKKLVVLVIILVSCVLIGLWSPWRGLNINLGGLFGITELESLSGLQVYSLSGTIEVYIDNELKGEIDIENSPLSVDKITPGERIVTLKRKSDIDNSYKEINKLISFVGGTNVVMSYNIGPVEEYSEGHIIYPVVKDNLNDKTTLFIKSNVEDVSLQIDSSIAETIRGLNIEKELDLSKQHLINIKKNGYEPLEFNILPSVAEEREKLINYNLILEVDLMEQPLDIEDI